MKNHHKYSLLTVALMGALGSANAGDSVNSIVEGIYFHANNDGTNGSEYLSLRAGNGNWTSNAGGASAAIDVQSNGSILMQAGTTITISGNTENVGAEQGVVIKSQGNANDTNGAYISVLGTNNVIKTGTGTNTIEGVTNNINGDTNNINGVTNITGATTVVGATSVTGATSINGTLTTTGNATIATNASTTNTFGSGANSTNSIGNAGTSTNTLQGNRNDLTATGAGSQNNISAATNTITATTANSIQGPVNNIGTAAGVTINTVGNTTVGTTVTAKAGNAQMALANNSATLTVPTASVTENTLNGFAAKTDYASMTGGNESPTSLTMTDRAATFSRVSNGAPITVTGVADGKGDFDAVNVRQFAGAIAATAAMAHIPSPEAGKELSVGVGLGNFMGKSALAFGGNYRMSADSMLKASISTGVNGGAKPVVGIGAGWNW
jgi:YadA-like membrane anchor domain